MPETGFEPAYLSIKDFESFVSDQIPPLGLKNNYFLKSFLIPPL